MKYSIFENTVGLAGIGITPSLETFTNHTDEITRTLGKRALGVLQQLPWVKAHIGAIGPAWFLSVKETIVCVDDIERRGDNLAAREVLGLVSILKEQRKCKVILIWNDDAEDKERAEFERYHEKVVDRSLKFAPTPAESTRIALAQDSTTLRMLAEDCIALGISNIRLIKRIERSVLELEKLLSMFDGEVLRDAVHTFTLVSWIIYEPGKGPSLDFLRNKRGSQLFSEDKTGALEDSESARTERATEASWNALLDAYKFRNMDELDLVLLGGAQNGFFDEPSLRQCAQGLNDRIMAARSDNSFSEAWDLYNDSFADNQKQVLDAIYAAFKTATNRISLTSLNSTVDLFKTLGRPDQAREMIEAFVQARGQERSAFDLNAFPFSESVTDPDVVKALHEKLATFPSKMAPKAILIAISETSSWNSDDLRDLAALPVEDYYELLKRSRGYELRHIINACLKFDNVIGASPEMQELSRRARAALRRIGEESAINARRVRRYGVIIDPTSKGAEGKS